MSVRNTVREREIEDRAEWLARLYQVPSDEVVKALKRASSVVVCRIKTGIVTSWKFDPSLEEAFGYLYPDVALELFSRIDVKQISIVLEILKQLKFSRRIPADLEEIIRLKFEAEPTLVKPLLTEYGYDELCGKGKDGEPKGRRPGFVSDLENLTS